MASKRYQVTLAPFVGLNGKLGQSKDKCEVLPDSNSSGMKFYYGAYKIQRNLAVFGLREKSRNLYTNPYSTNETNVKTYFGKVSVLVKNIFLNPTSLEKARLDFKNHGDGKTSFRGFVFGKVWRTSQPGGSDPYSPYGS